jgi:hypothetical protein
VTEKEQLTREYFRSVERDGGRWCRLPDPPHLVLLNKLVHPYAVSQAHGYVVDTRQIPCDDSSRFVLFDRYGNRVATAPTFPDLFPEGVSTAGLHWIESTDRSRLMTTTNNVAVIVELFFSGWNWRAFGSTQNSEVIALGLEQTRLGAELASLQAIAQFIFNLLPLSQTAPELDNTPIDLEAIH